MKSKNFDISAEVMLHKLKFPNLKRHCIIRGMPFEEVSNSILYLQSWFINNYRNPINPQRLNQYDEWIENLLKEREADSSLLNPELKLGYVVEKDEEGNVIKNKKIIGISKRVKKEKTEDGLRTGTKKAYIIELQKQGLTKEEVILKVKEKYTDINDSYIISWYNKAKKGKLKKK